MGFVAFQNRLKEMADASTASTEAVVEVHSENGHTYVRVIM
jgi:hypothetical protein